jgi:glucose-6-phosphate 1-epimerase
MVELSAVPGITLDTQPSGSRILRIEHAKFSAALSLDGGQLLQFAPTGQRPWLYLSPEALFVPGKAIRGGIPVCWPWFGPHPADPAAPQHGIARTAPWQPDSIETDPDGVAISLSGPTWQGLEVALELRLGEKLDLKLVSHNKSERTFHLGAALHTYLAVGEARRAEITGLAGSRFDDKVSGAPGRHEADRVSCQGEIDRIVYDKTQLELVDPVWHRCLRLSRSDAASVVLWNPGEEKARALKDLPDDGWHDFFCVEAALAGETCRELAPGDSYSFGTRIECIQL